MSAQSDFSHGRECGLRVLRELVSPGGRVAGGSAAVRGGGTGTGESGRMRVVCIASGELAEK